LSVGIGCRRVPCPSIGVVFAIKVKEVLHVD
jgi:hypothetical protein